MQHGTADRQEAHSLSVGEHSVALHYRHHVFVECVDCSESYLLPSFDKRVIDAQKFVIGKLLKTACEPESDGEQASLV